jgi:hypothetical protein
VAIVFLGRPEMTRWTLCGIERRRVSVLQVVTSLAFAT